MIRVIITRAIGQLGKCLQKIIASYPGLEFSFKQAKELDNTDSNNAMQFLTPFHLKIVSITPYISMWNRRKNT